MCDDCMPVMIPTIKFACVEFLHCVHIGYHGLHGSTSPVLMVAGFVNRKWQFSHRTESTPLNQSPRNLSKVIMPVTLQLCQIWCISGEGLRVNGWIFIYDPFLGNSRTDQTRQWILAHYGSNDSLNLVINVFSSGLLGV